jgi:hypothetical protein
MRLSKYSREKSIFAHKILRKKIIEPLKKKERERERIKLVRVHGLRDGSAFS